MCSLRNNWQIWDSYSIRTHTLLPAFRKKRPQNWRYIPQDCKFGSRIIEQNSRKPNSSNQLGQKSRPALPRETWMPLQHPLMVPTPLPCFIQVLRYFPSNSAHAPILRLSQTILLATKLSTLAVAKILTSTPFVLLWNLNFLL